MHGWLTDFDFLPSFGLQCNILRYSTYDVHASLVIPLGAFNEIISINQLSNVKPSLLIHLAVIMNKERVSFYTNNYEVAEEKTKREQWRERDSTCT